MTHQPRLRVKTAGICNNSYWACSQRFFFYSFMYTRIIGQYNGNWPISFVYVSEPPIAVITALVVHFQSLFDCGSVWHTPSRTMKVKDDREELSDVTNLLWGWGKEPFVHSSQSLTAFRIYKTLTFKFYHDPSWLRHFNFFFAFKMATYFPKYQWRNLGKKKKITRNSKWLKILRFGVPERIKSYLGCCIEQQTNSQCSLKY